VVREGYRVPEDFVIWGAGERTEYGDGKLYFSLFREALFARRSAIRIGILPADCRCCAVGAG
jgi:hypothetical protein